MGYILTADRTSTILFERAQCRGYILTADRRLCLYSGRGIYINCIRLHPFPFISWSHLFRVWSHLFRGWSHLFHTSHLCTTLLACWLPAFFWLRCSDFCIPNEAEKKKNADKTMWKSKSSLVFGGPLSAVQSLSSFLIVCRYYGLYIIVQKLRCDQRCQSNCKGGVYFPIAGTTFNIDKLEDVLQLLAND